MKKITILIVSLLLLNIALAQNSSSSLNLEDILILGKSEAMADSLSPAADNPLFTDNRELDKLQFTPYFNDYQNIDKVLEKSFQHRGLVQLMAGTKSDLLGRFMYQIPDFQNMKISGKYYNSENSKREIDFDLSSVIKQHDVFLSFNNLKYDNEISENDVTGIRLSLPEFKIKTRNYLPDVLALNLSWNNYKTILDNDDWLDIIHDVDEDIFDVYAGAKWDLETCSPEFSIANVNKQFWGKFSLDVSNRYGFDQLGLWLGADKYRAVPSISYAKSINLGNNFSLGLRNTPQIGSNSRNTLINEYNNLKTDADIITQKTPVNHYVILQKNDNFSVFWNCRYTYDYYNYYMYGIYPWLEYPFTIPHYYDAWNNSIGFKGNYDWKGINFTAQNTFYLFSADIEYQPNIETYLEAEYQAEKYRCGLDFTYSSFTNPSAFTDDEQSGKYIYSDELLLNANFRYLAGRHFTFLLEINNILNKDYRGYAQSVSEADSGIQLMGGFSYSF